jgi:hypothetical protein
MPKRPLNIDRAAWALICRFGDESAKVAFQRASICTHRNDDVAASEWRLVVQKVVELHFARNDGFTH